MLQFQTIEPTTLGLLEKLCLMQELSNFALIWWTNLSLRYWHRKSIDIDLFTSKKFDSMLIASEIKKKFPDSIITSLSENMWFMIVENIKLDLVYVPYENISPIETFGNIRMISEQDTIAMKLNAVARRWLKKDFWDVAYILDKYSVFDILSFYQKKFDIQEVWYLIRALVYFEDAEKDTTNPISLKNISREEIKNKIRHKVKDFIEADLKKL